MITLVIVLRLIHVVLGALWLGMMGFLVVFLTPSVQEAGPAGGKVMEALQRRGMMNIVPVLALGTLLSGAALYWIVSGGFSAPYMGSRAGITFGIGGLSAIIAWIIGLAIMRPAMLGAAATAQALASATSDDERSRLLAQAMRFRTRGAHAGRLAISLVFLAACAMAVARYL